MDRKEYYKEYHLRNKDKEKDWREKNKEKLKEYSRQYHKQNKDREKEYHKKYYLKNRERELRRIKSFYQIFDNRKKKNEYNKKYLRNWYYNKTELKREYNKRYRDKYLDKINLSRKKRRHTLGVSKKYNSELGISYTKEYKRITRQRRKAMLKGGGDLPIERIQKVYEDNIKKYNTLTCYLCYVAIQFGNDSIDHKIPLFRGGTNEYENLGVAHILCNKRKHTKTEEEYRNWLIEKEVLSL